MIGEIRLQWWRDAIEAAQSDSLTGNPVADAVMGLIRRRGLPIDLFTHVLDARITDLYADPMPDEATFVAVSRGHAAYRLRTGSAHYRRGQLHHIERKVLKAAEKSMA